MKFSAFFKRKIGKGGKEKEAPKAAMGPPPKPKKIPPPPACFSPEDLARFKELYKAHDEENIDKKWLARKQTVYLMLRDFVAHGHRQLRRVAFVLLALVKLPAIPLMLRKLGFNPKGHEIDKLFELFLEDDLVDTVEYHEFLLMIEAKMGWGDDFELAVTKAFATLGHDEEETGNADMELLKEELMEWGEPLQEIELFDLYRLATKDKTYNPVDGIFNYAKFIENMNGKDQKFFNEPINFFKLDQKTLAAMAIKKAQEEKEEQERKEAERLEKEEAKRKKMIEKGLIVPD